MGSEKEKLPRHLEKLWSKGPMLLLDIYKEAQDGLLWRGISWVCPRKQPGGADSRMFTQHGKDRTWKLCSCCSYRTQVVLLEALQ